MRIRMYTYNIYFGQYLPLEDLITIWKLDMILLNS